jgi:hypothetical protein
MMKKEFDDLKKGECFRLTKNGPVYQSDEIGDAQCITGKRAGKVIFRYENDNRKVYPVKVKIVEEK